MYGNPPAHLPSEVQSSSGTLLNIRVPLIIGAPLTRPDRDRAPLTIRGPPNCQGPLNIKVPLIIKGPMNIWAL